MPIPKIKFGTGIFVVLLAVLMGLLVQQSASSTTTSSTVCVNKKTGVVRVITSGSCKATETFVAVGLSGEQGEMGPAGPAGPAGPQGEPGLTFPETAASFTDSTALLKFVTSSGFSCDGPDNWSYVANQICQRTFSPDESFTLNTIWPDDIYVQLLNENCSNAVGAQAYRLRSVHLPITLKEIGQSALCIRMYTTGNSVYMSFTYSSS